MKQDIAVNENERLPAPVSEKMNDANTPAYWSGVFAMTLCVFSLIASEFMPVSLLTPIAGTLKVSEGLAGQGIAISGAFAVFTSLFISVLAGRLNRKTLLLGLTATMGLSGVIVAMAPNYPTYMLGRALIGVVVGGFWSMSAAIAMRLVPLHQVSHALAIFNGGNALAMVVAAPLGAYLGASIGWRGAFFCLAPIALITFIWQWISLPSMPVENRPVGVGNAFNVFKLLRRRVVLIGMLAIGCLFMGQFTLFTYVRPFLEVVSQVDVATLPFALLVIGVAGFLGTALITTVLKRGFYQTLIGIPVLMSGIAICLILFGDWAAVAIALLGLWGLVATAAPIGWWAWVPKTFPNDAETGGGLMVAVIQLSIALGSTMGGLLLDVSGFQSVFWGSAALLLMSALFTWRTAREAAASVN